MYLFFQDSFGVVSSDDPTESYRGTLKELEVQNRVAVAQVPK
jgi:hypothetical protein